jgi:hypothetical protein
MSLQPATLFGVPHSLYTGRARSYLIEAGIAYCEQAPNTEHYLKTVLPLAGGRLGMPTLELSDGRVIRDGAAIIDHFEEDEGHPFSPATPKQRFVSRLFDVIGAEGLLRPAMHYRWNFDALDRHFAARCRPRRVRAQGRDLSGRGRDPRNADRPAGRPVGRLRTRDPRGGGGDQCLDRQAG